MMFVPPELVREIITHVFDREPIHRELGDTRGTTAKQSWLLLQSLSLASKAYRALTLEAWFHTLFVKSPADISTAQELFPEIKRRWTRELHCVQVNTEHMSVWDLSGFERLSKVRLDWMAWLMMPRYYPGYSTDRLPFSHRSPSVIELEIRGLPWPSPVVLQNIDQTFPYIQVLKMRQRRIWCGLCHTCQLSAFRAPGPDSIVYEGGLGLPTHYARAFCSLSRLHTVCLAVVDVGSGSTTLSNDSEHNKYLWAGECDDCMEVMYEDTAFRDRWVSRKKGISLEGNKDETLFIRPPALQRVEWNFWKPDFDALSAEEDLESDSCIGQSTSPSRTVGLMPLHSGKADSPSIATPESTNGELPLE